MRNNNRQQKIDKLLFSTSQYEEEETDSLRNELCSAQNRFMRNGVLDLDVEGEQDEEGVVLGNQQSMESDGHQWSNQENAKYYFREVAGNSENFSQSLSIHRPDYLESKGMQENSINLDTINLQNMLNAKKKQQQKVNEVLDTEINELVQKIQKQQCLIKNYKKRIEEQQNIIQRLRAQNQVIQAEKKQYLYSLQKKDELFNAVKTKYTQVLQDQQRIEQQTKSMEKEIERLRNVIKSFTNQEKGLLDFNNLTPKRSQSFKSITTSRELDNMEAELQKLRRQKKNCEIQCEIVKEDLCRKEQKHKSLEDDLRRKISMKEKKIKQLQQNMEQNRDELLKMKKNNDSSATAFRQKLIRTEKDLGLKEQKVKELQSKVKMSIDEIKKKEQKIKELLTQISDKNKKITQLKDVLQQEEARNQIQTRLQKERENQIDKLEQQVKELKTDKFNLKRDIQNLQKPSNVEQKLKKEIAGLKKDNQILTKQVTELNQSVSSLEKEMEAKDEKLRDFKKKNDQLMKKSVLTKKKSDDAEMINHQNQTYREVIAKLTKQNSQLRKKTQSHQEMANKLYILESRIKFNQEKVSPTTETQNEYDLEEINEALKEQLQNKDIEIEQIKALHHKEIQRLVKERNTLAQAADNLEEEINFKEKALEFLHRKFVDIEKQNAELKAHKNILHSSFYDESYDREQNQAIHFYENKVQSLEKKIETLNMQIKEKDNQIRKIVSQRENSSFQISQLKNRIKDLQTMAIASEPARKIAPQSLTHQQTIDFLLKMLKRIIKSAEMLKSLSKIHEFKTIVGNLWKLMDRDLARN